MFNRPTIIFRFNVSEFLCDNVVNFLHSDYAESDSHDLWLAVAGCLLRDTDASFSFKLHNQVFKSFFLLLISKADFLLHSVKDIAK